MAATTITTRPLSDRVSEEIRVEMARQRINQVELAARMHVAQPWISRRLSGKTPLSLDDVERIAIGLKVHVSDLLGPAARLDFSGPRRRFTLVA